MCPWLSGLDRVTDPLPFLMVTVCGCCGWVGIPGTAGIPGVPGVPGAPGTCGCRVTGGTVGVVPAGGVCVVPLGTVGGWAGRGPPDCGVVPAGRVCPFETVGGADGRAPVRLGGVVVSVNGVGAGRSLNASAEGRCRLRSIVS